MFFDTNNKKPLIGLRLVAIAIFVGLFVPLSGVGACTYAIDQMTKNSDLGVSRSSAP